MPPFKQGILLWGAGEISAIMVMTAQRGNEEGNVMTTKRNDGAHMRIGREPPGSPASGGRPDRRPPQADVRRGRARRRGARRSGCLRRGGRLQGRTPLCPPTARPSPAVAGTRTPRTPASPAGTTLKTVPGQVSSGPGWSYNANDSEVIVTGNGTVISGLYIPSHARDQRLQRDGRGYVQVVTGASFGISLTNTANVTIKNPTISGLNATTGRVGSAIDDVYGNSTPGSCLTDNNISYFKTADAGIVQPGGRQLHLRPGYLSGDRTNGFYVNGGTAAADDRGQYDLQQPEPRPTTSTSTREATGVAVADRTVENNFLAGGGYCIYGGHRPEQHHLEHRHRGRPRLSPPYYALERPVRPRRLLRHHRDGQRLVRQLLGHHRAGHPRPVTIAPR